GTVLGTAVAGADGQFSVTLQPPQTDGQPLQVTVTDPAGNVSSATAITAPNDGVGSGGDTTPPAPASNVIISADGRTVSGRGEVGATVNVLNDQGQLIGTGTVQPDGSFTLQLTSPVVDGSSLQVTLTDAAGNV
ncbi:Ig-like domain-containing protein, partial [Pseudomonas urethralis]